MAVEVKVPSVGESITEGTIARWIKKEGDFVRQDESIFELETEKASQEVPAPATGILRPKAKEGDRVPIGGVVAEIEPASQGATPPAPPPPAPAPKSGPPPFSPPPLPRPPAPPAISPAARRVAAEAGLDASQIPGSGKHGIVLKEDVQAALDRPPEKKPGERPPPFTPPAGAAPGGETRQRMSAIRQRIAERLVQAQQSTASLTTFNEADMSAVMDLRTRYKDRFKEKHNVGLGFMSFFVKAAVEALKAFPQVNARIDGTDIVYQNFYNIGVAVSTEKGLMVPVLRDVDRMSFADVEKAVAGLAVRARDGKISVNELQGGTFTITNGGIFGSMLSTPILNPPQSAILGMHAIQKRPVVRDEQIVARPMMYLALTYDHRLIDGREAVQFLVVLKECVENPGRLLLDI